MAHFEMLLLNILIVVFPYFLYQFFMDRHTITPRHSRFIVGALAASSILLCMAFPYWQVSGYVFDLRSVPLILSYCYGGKRAGLFATATFVLARWFLGGDGFIVSTVSYALTLIPVLLVMPRWKDLSPLKQRVFGALFITLSCGFTDIGCYFFDPHLMSSLDRTMLNMWLLNLFTMLLSLQLIDQIKSTAILRMEMLRTEKLQVVSELAASIAHEVRNPMTAARGFSQLLAKAENLTEKQASYLQMIQGELDRAQGIINDYLSYARPQVDDVQTLNLSDEIQRVLSIISPYAALQGVNIQFTDSPDTIQIVGSSGKLVQALVNIVKNAVEAQPGDGSIEIKATAKSNLGTIEVIDSGVGMTSEQLSHLGSPFYSTKTQGTGLGMMTTYRIIQAMNGSISVHSDLGKGTTFSVTLPRFTDRQSQ